MPRAAANAFIELQGGPPEDGAAQDRGTEGAPAADDALAAACSQAMVRAGLIRHTRIW